MTTGRSPMRSISVAAEVSRSILSAANLAPTCVSGYARQSDELRPVWLYWLTLAGLCPGRAVRLTFPSLSGVYDRACPSQGLPRTGSAITTRLNHPTPKQDLHLQACQRPKAAHRPRFLARPPALHRLANNPRSSGLRKCLGQCDSAATIQLVHSLYTACTSPPVSVSAFRTLGDLKATHKPVTCDPLAL